MLYLAIQDNKILGTFDSFEEASKRIKSEVENDKIKHVLKRGVAKHIVNGKSKMPSFEDRYSIATCIDENVIYKFDPTEPTRLLISAEVKKNDGTLHYVLEQLKKSAIKNGTFKEGDDE